VLNFIRANYTRMTDAAIAESLRRVFGGMWSKRIIGDLRRRLKWKRKVPGINFSTPWSEDAIHYLRQNWQKRSDEEMAADLTVLRGRHTSVHAVEIRRSLLGLLRREPRD
jgi:hypothetical protein